MLRPHFSVYLGTEEEVGFAGFVADNDFYAILQIDEGFSKEEGREFLKKLAVEATQKSFEHAADLESFLADCWEEANLPARFSFACLLKTDSALFIKTYGGGEIYLRRNRDFDQLLSGNNFASGHITGNDFFVLTTDRFSNIVGGQQAVGSFFDHKKPIEVLEDVTLLVKERGDKGTVALFILFEQETLEEEVVSETPRSSTGISLQKAWTKFRSAPQEYGMKRVVTLGIVVLLFVIFVWSVVLGYQRRINEKSAKEITFTKELVTQKLQQAEDVAFLNSARAVALVNDAKKDVSELKKKIGNTGAQEVRELEQLIKAREGAILHKDEKPAQEYFDLSVEQKDAKGEHMWFSDDRAIILDSRGTVYLLSLDKKSMEKRVSSEIRGAKLAGAHKDAVYVFKPKSGLFSVSDENKGKKVIENDKDWGSIGGMEVYNGNVYLLDNSKGQIYRYVATDDGFASKSAYFSTGASKAMGARSFAIDSSVYVGFPGQITKYTAGLQDGFNPSFPEDQISIEKVITHVNVEKIYVWDKERGILYVVAKTGSYERQIQSSVFKKAGDVIVSGNNAFALLGQKIYQISLE